MYKVLYTSYLTENFNYEMNRDWLESVKKKKKNIAYNINSIHIVINQYLYGNKL